MPNLSSKLALSVLDKLDKGSYTCQYHCEYMEYTRKLSHLAKVSKDAQSIKTTIPLTIVKKLKLRFTDVIEWYITEKDEVCIRKLR
jgi:hypothetical protein